MANINRLKVVLVEKGKTGRWLANELGKSNCTVSKWCSNTTTSIVFDRLGMLYSKMMRPFAREPSDH